MATIDDPRTEPIGSAPRAPRLRRSGRYRWTAEQLLWLDRMGFFDDRHVELVDGEIHEMTTNPPHTTAVALVVHLFRRVFPDRLIREEKHLDFGRRNWPEPDIALVEGTIHDYTFSHPRSALLIVEVSDSTLRKDRKLKGHLYAHAGIADYWILNLVDRQLEIYRDPGPDPDRKGRFRYAEVTIVPADGHASPLAKPEARIAVADMLPIARPS